MPKTEEVKFKKGDLVKYEARVHKGTGVFLRYEPSLKGMWIVLKRDDNGKELALRVSQVKPRAGKPAPTVKAKPVKADPAPVAAKAPAAPAVDKPKRIRPSRAEQRARAAAKASTSVVPNPSLGEHATPAA